jgi:hypothetical protein
MSNGFPLAGEVFLERMKMLGNQVSPANGEVACKTLRRFVEQAFPGPVELKTAVCVMTVANVLADMVSEIDRSTPIMIPEADGRVRAIEAAFRDVLHRAIRDRSVQINLAHNIAKQGN